MDTGDGKKRGPQEQLVALLIDEGRGEVIGTKTVPHVCRRRRWMSKRKKDSKAWASSSGRCSVVVMEGVQDAIHGHLENQKHLGAAEGGDDAGSAGRWTRRGPEKPQGHL